MTDSESRKGMAALAACAVLWSSGGLLIKLVDWHPLAIAGARSGVALLMILFVRGRRPLRITPTLLLASLFHAGTMILFVAGTRLTTAANAILLQYSAPVYVAVLGWAMLKEKPAAHHWAALAAVAAGLLLFFRDNLAGGQLTGNILAIGSGITFALFSLFMRKQKDAEPLDSIVISNILTVLVGVPFYGRGNLPDAVGWAAVAGLGLFQTGLALMFFSYGIRRITALSAMLIATLEPMLNPVWVFLVLGERPGMWPLIGGGIILLSVTVSSVLSIIRPGENPPASRRRSDGREELPGSG